MTSAVRRSRRRATLPASDHASSGVGQLGRVTPNSSSPASSPSIETGGLGRARHASARHPEPLGLARDAVRSQSADTVRGVAQRPADACRGRVVEERLGLGGLGPEPVECQREDGATHLGPESSPLIRLPEPRAGVHRPQRREIGRGELLHADGLQAREDTQDQAPPIGPPVGPGLQVELIEVALETRALLARPRVGERHLVDRMDTRPGCGTEGRDLVLGRQAQLKPVRPQAEVVERPQRVRHGGDDRSAQDAPTRRRPAWSRSRGRVRTTSGRG